MSTRAVGANHGTGRGACAVAVAAKRGAQSLQAAMRRSRSLSMGGEVRFAGRIGGRAPAFGRSPAERRAKIAENSEVGQ
jgi:hypothetical protein